MCSARIPPRRARPRGSHAECVFFFFLRFSFHFFSPIHLRLSRTCSHLSSKLIGSTQGDEFSNEVKHEISATEILMISLAPTKKKEKKKKAEGSNPSWSSACLPVSKQVGRISPAQPVGHNYFLQEWPVLLTDQAAAGGWGQIEDENHPLVKRSNPMKCLLKSLKSCLMFSNVNIENGKNCEKKIEFITPAAHHTEQQAWMCCLMQLFWPDNAFLTDIFAAAAAATAGDFPHNWHNVKGPRSKCKSKTKPRYQNPGNNLFDPGGGNGSHTGGAAEKGGQKRAGSRKKKNLRSQRYLTRSYTGVREEQKPMGAPSHRGNKDNPAQRGNRLRRKYTQGGKSKKHNYPSKIGDIEYMTHRWHTYLFL